MQTGRKATRQRSDLARSKTDVICRGLPREAQVVNAHSLPDSPTARQPDSPTARRRKSRSAVQPFSRRAASRRKLEVLYPNQIPWRQIRNLSDHES